MNRMKTFFKYALWVVLFFIFSQVLIYVSLNTTYKYKTIEIKNSIIKEAEVQATSIDGVAKIKLVNDTKNDIENKYLSLDCYSKNDVLMGTKYVKIDKISAGEEKEYEIRFNFNKVDNVKMDIIDSIPENTTQTQLVSDSKMNTAMIITALLLLFRFG